MLVMRDWCCRKPPSRSKWHFDLCFLSDGILSRFYLNTGKQTLPAVSGRGLVPMPVKTAKLFAVQLFFWAWVGGGQFLYIFLWVRSPEQGKIALLFFRDLDMKLVPNHALANLILLSGQSPTNW